MPGLEIFLILKVNILVRRYQYLPTRQSSFLGHGPSPHLPFSSIFLYQSAPFPQSLYSQHPSQLHYRLSICPELSLGLFSTTAPDTPSTNLPTYPSARSPNAFTPTLRSVLIAHVIATKCSSPTITDRSMEFPQIGNPPVVSPTPGAIRRAGVPSRCIHWR